MCFQKFEIKEETVLKYSSNGTSQEVDNTGFVTPIFVVKQPTLIIN